MTCQNCKAENIEGSKFCLNCGQSLESNQVIEQNQSVVNETPVMQPVQQPVQNVQPVSFAQPAQSMNNGFEQPVQQMNNAFVQQNVINNTSKGGVGDYFKLIINFLMKPFKTFKEQESFLNDKKNSAIISLIVVALMTIFNMFVCMIDAMFTKTYDLTTFKYVSKFSLEGLKNLDYLKLIGLNFVAFVLIIVIIVGVYYFASLIFKKSFNLFKVLSVAALSLVPYALGSLLLSPLLGKIWGEFYIIIAAIGIIYSFVIFWSIIENDFHFEDVDKNIIFHVVCLALVGIGWYYVDYKLVNDGYKSISNDNVLGGDYEDILNGDYSNILDMFN